jgi:mannosyltransferase OCH1-like enzyme
MSNFLTNIITSPTIKKNKSEKKKQLLTFFDLYLKIKIPYPIKKIYNCCIPANIFQTWHSKTLPPLMLNAVNKIKKINPNFNYQLFDDNDCRIFIQNNFSPEVLYAFNTLKPGAYKADLWRYCILYKKGGVYLDIKYIPANGFKFINLLEKEHWVLDADNNGIYNAVMICKAGNKILWKAINDIVNNVKNKYYGNSCLDITGPGLLARYFSREEKNIFDMKHNFFNSFNNRYVLLNNYFVLKSYNGYLDESKKNQKVEHYGHLWNIKQIYN